MSESDPDRPPAASAAADAARAADPLAARLLAVQNMLATLAALGADAEARLRLNNRFMAICTALKMPGASRIRCISRLNELMAEAEQVRAGSFRSPHKEV